MIDIKECYNELSKLSYRSKAMLAAGVFLIVQLTILITGGLNYFFFNEAEKSRRHIIEEIIRVNGVETEKGVQ